MRASDDVPLGHSDASSQVVSGASCDDAQWDSGVAGNVHTEVSNAVAANHNQTLNLPIVDCVASIGIGLIHGFTGEVDEVLNLSFECRENQLASGSTLASSRTRVDDEP
jgi:hypothetical protein